MDALAPFPSAPINSVRAVMAKAEEAMDTALKIVDGGKIVPLTFFIHTQGDEAMRFLPSEIPRDLIAPIVLSVAKSNEGASALIHVSEAWALRTEGTLKVATPEAREWVASGQSIQDHPDAIEIVMVNASCQVGGFGQYNYCGTAMIKNANGARRLDPAKWFVADEMSGALVMPVEEMLTTIEDADFLREEMNKPRDGTYSDAANDWG